MGYSSASEGEIVESDGEMKATTQRASRKDPKINDLDRPRSYKSGSYRPRADYNSEGLDYDDRTPSSRHGTPEGHGRGDDSSRGLKRRLPDDDRPYHQAGDTRSHKRYHEGDLLVRSNRTHSPGRGRFNGYSAQRNEDRRSRRDFPGPDEGRRNGRREEEYDSRDRQRVLMSPRSAVSNGSADIDNSSRRASQTSHEEFDLSSAAKKSESQNGTTKKSQTREPSQSGQIEEEAESHTVDEATLIEERRKRREALRAKHGRETSLIHKALNATASSASAGHTPESFIQNSPTIASANTTAPSTPQADSPDSPAAISVADDAELANDTGFHNSTGDEANGPSAADYDPSMDMQEDRVQPEMQDLNRVRDQIQTDSVVVAQPKKKSNPTNEEPAEFDMFADDMDMESPEQSTKLREDDGINGFEGVKGKQLDKSMLDDWDDPEGYYRIILGEILDKRYQVQTNLGKGVFSAVVRAHDNRTGKTVAIKIIRKQETMYKAGLKEINTLERLAEADPEDKKHIIRLERHFMHKSHLCMVFENLSINLREVLKKFGRDIGINIKAVRAYAQQIFLGLSLMKKCDILHADLKPDNVLVNENRSQLKIADLGSAIDIQDSEVTDVLVSRFYRAPEIMLGIKGDYALDMWSIGCTLFELYTGRICFTGSTNNQMLKAIMECRGKIPNRMLKKAEFWAQHFDADGTFLSQEYDEITRKEVTRKVNIVRATPAKELRARLFAGSKNLSVAEAKELNLFADLLDKCLALDPQRRITPNEALRHGFINRAAVTTPAKPK